MSREITIRGLSVDDMKRFNAAAKGVGSADKAALLLFQRALRPRRSVGFKGILPSEREIEVEITLLGDGELSDEDKAIARELTAELGAALKRIQERAPSEEPPAAPEQPAQPVPIATEPPPAAP